MPTDQRVWFGDSEGIPPVEQTRQPSQRKPNGVGSATWLYISFNKKAELFAQKQILGRDAVVGVKHSFIKVNESRKTAKMV